MATVTKDFRVKNGLVVEGSNATVNGHDVLTEGLVDAKGDLIVASGADAVTTLAAGTNGYVLTADSSEATGLKWAAAPAVGTFESSVTFEGATADSYQTTLTVTDPTADRTITLPDADGTVALTGDITTAVDDLDTDDIEEGINNLYYTDARAKSSAVDLLTNATLTNITIQNSFLGGLEITAENGVADSTTDDLTEGTTNKYYSDTLVDDHLSGGDGITYSAGTISADLGTGLEISMSGGIQIDRTTVDGWYDAAGDAAAAESAANTYTDTALEDYTPTTSLDTTVGGYGYLKSEDQFITSLTSGTTSGLHVNNGELSFNAGTGLVINGVDGLVNVDTETIATKAYVDATAQGLDIKASVQVSSVTNIDIANPGTTIDGATLTNGDRVLIKDQTDASENGIYSVSGSPLLKILTRTDDAIVGDTLTKGAFVFVENGTNAGKGFVANVYTPALVTMVDWTQFSETGNYITSVGTNLDVTGGNLTVDLSSKQDTLSVGDGLTLSSSTLNLDLATSGGLYIDNSDKLAVDGFYVTFNGSAQTLTNKTLTSPKINEDVVLTATATELNLLDGVTATTAELNLLDGVTATTTELNYVDGVTSAIQDQLDDKAPLVSPSFTTPDLGAATATSIALTDALMATATQTLTGTSATIIDEWSSTTYSAAKYLVQMKNGNDIEILEVLVAIDGNNNVYLTEYADVISNEQLGTTDASYSGGKVSLLVTASNGTTVKVHKTLIEA